MDNLLAEEIPVLMGLDDPDHSYTQIFSEKLGLYLDEPLEYSEALFRIDSALIQCVKTFSAYKGEPILILNDINSEKSKIKAHWAMIKAAAVKCFVLNRGNGENKIIDLYFELARRIDGEMVRFNNKVRRGREILAEIATLKASKTNNPLKKKLFDELMAMIPSNESGDAILEYLGESVVVSPRRITCGDTGEYCAVHELLNYDYAIEVLKKKRQDKYIALIKMVTRHGCEVLDFGDYGYVEVKGGDEELLVFNVKTNTPKQEIEDTMNVDLRSYPDYDKADKHLKEYAEGFNKRIDPRKKKKDANKK
jgi:hypothetical protein